ncbi:putative peptide maturation dehydrogenase [Dokdonella immobilis]|uniref:Putative peptide maturation dehydrogenase n=1 Tax=Dokdonella immobilis TaxID=578942 RepID=A0A1I4XT51_9GAMM|nr:putative peptide maturation dehydrogenase [Dokdonella immobilis]SFN29014.1 putative peptide maturation dehydrogenase [Dokdonella immobilis]
MQVRRCAVVFVEPRERLDFDLARLVSGGTGVETVLEWIALAAHLDDELLLCADEMQALGTMSPEKWVDLDSIADPAHLRVLQGLLGKGLLISDAGAQGDVRRRDEDVRASHWRGISAALHRHTRWRGIDTLEAEQRFGRESDRPFLDRLGAPEAPVRERVEPGRRIALGKAADSGLEALIRQRVTCRNWDTTRPLSTEDFATTLYRTFGARATSDEPGITVMKRAVPSAGGLHPTEAYLLVQNVEGVRPGLYHYHPIDHALEPLAEVAPEDSEALALRLVAGQRHFMKAHVVIVLASRFRRTFWKYRNHAKAYRAVILDAGHLSQTLYLAAAERGLAAFITAAVNERDIEEIFGLDPMLEGVLAVSGFGWRGEFVDEVEFDPLGSVWPNGGGMKKVE